MGTSGVRGGLWDNFKFSQNLNSAESILVQSALRSVGAPPNARGTNTRELTCQALRVDSGFSRFHFLTNSYWEPAANRWAHASELTITSSRTGVQDFHHDEPGR